MTPDEHPFMRADIERRDEIVAARERLRERRRRALVRLDAQVEWVAATGAPEPESLPLDGEAWLVLLVTLTLVDAGDDVIDLDDLREHLAIRMREHLGFQLAALDLDNPADRLALLEITDVELQRIVDIVLDDRDGGWDDAA